MEGYCCDLKQTHISNIKSPDFTKLQYFLHEKSQILSNKYHLVSGIKAKIAS